MVSEAYWAVINNNNITIEENTTTKNNTIDATEVAKVGKAPPPPQFFVINEDIDIPDPSIRLKPIKAMGPNFRLAFNQ